MPHDTALISTIAVSLAYALAGGVIAARLHLSPLVGYLLAGIIVGPFTPGFVADTGLAEQLAEIGVMLLMFGVGMHFSIRDLLAVQRIALPGAIIQIAAATALGGALAFLWGWSFAAGLIFGLALSVASTVVLQRALEDLGALGSEEGRIAVGWLIVEDLIMILVLILLPAVAGLLSGQAPAGDAGLEAGPLLATLGRTVAKVAIFIALMLIVGTRLLPWLLGQVTRTGSRELFTLAVAAVALGVAFGSAELFDVSFALGAFFAGVVINESEYGRRAATELISLQDAFTVLFFVSVGMLFDPAVLLSYPLEVASVLAVIILGKSLVALAIVRLFRYPLKTALTISASLAQIGEFSFILAALGISLHVLPPEGLSLIVAGALLSITVNPFLFHAVAGIEAWRSRRDLRFSPTMRASDRAETPR